MAKLGISTGTTPNDGSGDSLLDGAVKVNSNFDEVYNKIGDGTDLFVGIVSSITVSGPLSISTTFGAPVITGLANTANINATNFQVTGVGTITGTTRLAGINTFSAAGYTVAGLVTASNIISNETIKVAGIVTTSEDGINVSAAVTARSLAIQDVTQTSHFVGLNTVFIDHTGVGATAINITDTATIGFGSISSANITTINANTANINSGILTTATVGTAITIHSKGIDAGQAGIITASRLFGAVTGAVTGTASSATEADLAYGLTGTPSIVVGVATLGGHIFNAPGAFISGILTATSFSVGTNEIVSSARQLKNIATLDATTKLTIENAISDPPNDFDDLNVVGLATVNRLFISGDTRGLNILGVTTGLSAPGITTLGIITGATSLQATDVYSNFLHGDGSNISNVTGGVTVQDEGSALSTVATTLNFVGSGVVASGSGATKTITISGGGGGGSIAGISTTGTSGFNQLNVTGVSTFGANIDLNANIDVSGSSTLHNGLVVNGGIVDINHQIVGLATDNVIPFYYANVSDFPSASTYHGAVAHGHNTGLLYFAHAGAWLELVSKDSSGVVNKIVVGAAVTIDQNNIDTVGIITASEFHGDGSNLTGITGSTVAGISTTGTSGFNQLSISGVSTFTGNIDANGALDVDGQTDLDVVNVAELATFSSRVQVGTGLTLDQNNIDAGSYVGIITAKEFHGDGTNVATSRWAVTNASSNHYVFNGPGNLVNANDPTIYLARGQKYEFDINASGHPFRIQTSSGASGYNSGNEYTTGITNVGAASSLLTFDVPFDANNTLYYVCQNHSSMNGTIIIYPSI
ncbi:baseplate wedge tail fiber protein connector [Prochlorococcus phage P-TIM68]|uniref:Baseplate structural protein Gp9/Gp10 N-terminal domain-containing protein n=1 Tax=Prochlorococcus phage P-TIM68 TaxID=1542477 RepID=A0A0K0KVR0_9CAUD|nr:baseplate wedge tail fiber protein connector [Prochlorococcus phage P-TIM68]AIR93428.1 hypothetical protein [Prochlorococcus phage P-TIM68]